EFEAFKARRMEFEPFKQWGQSGLPAVLLPNNRIIFELIDLNGTSCSLTPRD
ncbi:MAG: glutaredoxin, partial [Globicatella sulfidifaciens]|nr:glutaredoxin [Globicatella sulfidifaciens]